MTCTVWIPHRILPTEPTSNSFVKKLCKIDGFQTKRFSFLFALLCRVTEAVTQVSAGAGGVRSIRYAPHHARSKATVWCARRLCHSPVSHGNGTGATTYQLLPYARIPSTIPSAGRKTTSRRPDTRHDESPSPSPAVWGAPRARACARSCRCAHGCSRPQTPPCLSAFAHKVLNPARPAGPPHSFPYAAPIVYRKERSIGRARAPAATPASAWRGSLMTHLRSPRLPTTSEHLARSTSAGALPPGFFLPRGNFICSTRRVTTDEGRNKET